MSKKKRKIKNKLNQQLQKMNRPENRVQNTISPEIRIEATQKKVSGSDTAEESEPTKNIEENSHPYHHDIRADLKKFSFLSFSLVVILMVLYVLERKTNLLNSLSDHLFSLFNIFQA